MALEGTLDTFALPDVLHLLAATTKTGCLRVAGPAGAGEVWLADGAVAAITVAEAPPQATPIEALATLLRLDEGAFTFAAGSPPPADGPPQDVDRLLADALDLLAGWREVEAVLPSFDAPLELATALDAPTVTIPGDLWPTLAAVAAGPRASVRSLAGQLGQPELVVARRTCALVDLGVVLVASLDDDLLADDEVVPPAEAPLRPLDGPPPPPPPAPPAPVATAGGPTEEDDAEVPGDDDGIDRGRLLAFLSSVER